MDPAKHSLTDLMPQDCFTFAWLLSLNRSKSRLWCHSHRSATFSRRCCGTWKTVFHAQGQCVNDNRLVIDNQDYLAMGSLSRLWQTLGRCDGRRHSRYRREAQTDDQARRKVAPLTPRVRIPPCYVLRRRTPKAIGSVEGLAPLAPTQRVS